MQTYLELEDLWVAVQPKLKEDGTYEAVDAGKNRRARAKIILLLDPVNYVHVREAQTAQEVWSKLEKAFEDSGLTRRVGLLHKLIKTELASCDSMTDYVNQIVTTAHQLDGIGFAISAEWIGTLLLAGLPDEYRPMIMALENSGTPITGDAIKTKLLQEVQVSSMESALAAGRRGNHSGKQTKKPDSSKGPKCRKCQKFGHIAKDCKMPQQKSNAFCAVLSTFSSPQDDDWFFDSGASMHMTRNQNLLENMKHFSGTVVAANGGSMKVLATGSAVLEPRRQEAIPVEKVQLLPELSVNLLSVSQIVKKGHTVIFTDRGCKVVDKDIDVIATGIHENNLFKLDQDRQDTKSALACLSAVSLEVWHRRLGHLNIESIRRLADGLVDGVKINGSSQGNCRICPMGKQCRYPFSKQGSRAAEKLEIVHSDICGPMEVKSLGGKRYYIVFVDDKSRRMWVYFIKSKSERDVLETFKEFHAMAERQSGAKLKVIRTDNGKEYVNRGFEGYLKQHGIRHQTTNDYTPEQNGMAERANRSIVERAKCMLFEAGLSKAFWAEAVSTAVYLLNRSPTHGHDVTPEEAWSGRKPNLSHVRVFGTKAMVFIPKQKRRKWDPKSHECILTGFDEATKGYRLYDEKSRRIIKSREVTFIDEMVHEKVQVKNEAARGRTLIQLDFEEVVSLSPEEAPMQLEAEQPEEDDDEFFTDYETTDANEESSGENDTSIESVIDVTSVLPPRQSSNPPRSQVLRRSGREHKLPGKYDGFQLSSKCLPHINSPQTDDVDADVSGPSTSAANQGQFSAVVQPSPRADVRNDDDPVTHQQALSRDDSGQWKAAMKEEYEALMNNDTWKLTKLPEGRAAIKCKWVYKTKHDTNGDTCRYKARLVIKGYSQRKGVDYDETYSPVVRHSSLRYLFALAAKYHLQIDQMDAITAFLQGDLEEEIYMEQPPCFVKDEEPRLVCRLNKALYGLKHSSRVWNNKLDAALKRFGLIASEYDPCLYYWMQDGKMLFIAVYVDDVLIFSNDEQLKDAIKDKLSSTFRMKDLGPAASCLGIRIVCKENSVTLDQEAYINSILRRFNMQDAKAVTTPMNAAEKLTKEMSPKTAEETERMQKIPYQEAVGCLMYLLQCTRPDILFAVNLLSSFNNNLGPKH